MKESVKCSKCGQLLAEWGQSQLKSYGFGIRCDATKAVALTCGACRAESPIPPGLAKVLPKKTNG